MISHNDGRRSGHLRLMVGCCKFALRDIGQTTHHASACICLTGLQPLHRVFPSPGADACSMSPSVRVVALSDVRAMPLLRRRRSGYALHRGREHPDHRLQLVLDLSISLCRSAFNYLCRLFSIDARLW